MKSKDYFNKNKGKKIKHNFMGEISPVFVVGYSKTSIIVYLPKEHKDNDLAWEVPTNSSAFIDHSYIPTQEKDKKRFLYIQEYNILNVY